MSTQNKRHLYRVRLSTEQQTFIQGKTVNRTTDIYTGKTVNIEQQTFVQGKTVNRTTDIYTGYDCQQNNRHLYMVRRST